MKSHARFPLLAAFAIGVIGGSVATRSTASADDMMKMTTCPTFNAAKWVIPRGPMMEGTRYQITITGSKPPLRVLRQLLG